MLRVLLGNGDVTLTSEEINSTMDVIMEILGKKCGASLRDE